MLKASIVAVLLLGSLAPRAHAQAADAQAERARAHVKAGIAYYDDGRYDDAAREMEAAYSIKPLADLQYNLAQCYERIGKYDQAVGAYQKYLAGKPGAADRESVEARIDNLRERAKEAAAGKQPAPPPTVKTVLKTVVIYRALPPPPGRAARWAGYGLAALGAAALAAGIATTVLGVQDANTVSNGGNVMAPPAYDGKTRDAGDNAHTMAILAGVSYGVAGLAAAGSIALFYLGRKIDREAPKLTLAPSLAPSSAGLVALGRF